MLNPTDPQVLKTCPFCGSDAEVEIQGFRHSASDGVWAFIRCKHRCNVSPIVGESCATGHHSDRDATNSWVTTRTEQEAADISYRRAVTVWNTRHG